MVVKHGTNIGIDTLTGTADDDQLYGYMIGTSPDDDAGNDRLRGLDGRDLLRGGGGNDRLDGGAGDDWLDGGGGVDRLVGGAGDDMYYLYVDVANDLITELNDQGYDWAVVSDSYRLRPSASIEAMSTISSRSAQTINLTGNEFSQTIKGNAGANKIDGGAGADTMRGLSGNDTYYVDNAGDRVVEGAGQGALDWVATSVSYRLAAGVEIEKLSTKSSGATEALNLTGNEFAQTITGNAGNNTLNGRLGHDTLTGGAGEDTFVFNSSISAFRNIDAITDFNVADDSVQLAKGLFAGLIGTGTLSEAQFSMRHVWEYTGSIATIVYEIATGDLYYKVPDDGGTFHFATVTPNTALTNADFILV